MTGTWNGRAFEALGAHAEIHAKWMTITVMSREVGCTDHKLLETDMALQLTIPTGPANDFFAGHYLAVPIKLSGAGGVSAVPTGFSAATLDRVDSKPGGVVRGRVQFSWRTGVEEDAPSYDVKGAFEATICSAEATQASMPNLDRGRKPVTGKVSGRERTFPSFLAFVQKNGADKPLIRLKGYSRKDVSCFSDQPNTPYLFGPEIGAGPDGKYFAGAPMPADWIMQMVDAKFSERSVHAGEWSGMLQIDEVLLGRNGVVRGQMMAATVDEDDDQWSFEIAGSFEAPVCEAPYGQIAP
jgi:hypothetical protein